MDGRNSSGGQLLNFRFNLRHSPPQNSCTLRKLRYDSRLSSLCTHQTFSLYTNLDLLGNVHLQHRLSSLFVTLNFGDALKSHFVPLFALLSVLQLRDRYVVITHNIIAIPELTGRSAQHPYCYLIMGAFSNGTRAGIIPQSTRTQEPIIMQIS